MVAEVPDRVENFEFLHKEYHDPAKGGVYVVRVRQNNKLFILKSLKKTSLLYKFVKHRAEYQFMRDYCSDPAQRHLVHFFATYQNEVSAKALIFLKII